MSHQLTRTDGLVLTKKRAWHGIGVLVEEAPTPHEAMQLAGIDWQVQQWGLKATDPHTELLVSTHVANVRSDTLGVLGIVGKGYRPVQNAELASFAQALGQDGTVKVESAGTIRQGRRVWFLVRGESIFVHKGNDEVKPYLLIANSHDGSLAVSVLPTSIRVVCANTLHASLAEGEKTRTIIRFKHEGAIENKLEEVREALGLFHRTREQFAEQCHTLNAHEMDREELQRFWIDVYSKTIEEIPAYPVSEKEKEKAEECRRVLALWAANFDKDRARLNLPASRWTALNAITEYFDTQRVVRASDDMARSDNRLLNRWWGSGAVAKAKAFELALTR